MSNFTAELSQGRPRYRPKDGVFVTGGGVRVHRFVKDISETIGTELADLTSSLDSCRGCVFESAYEYPGRYVRWTLGFANPPIALESWGLKFRLSALNSRGKVILCAFEKSFQDCDSIDKETILNVDGNWIDGSIIPPAYGARFSEEERSKQNSVFSVLRNIIDLWSTKEDPQLGLYGSFGYDLAFQFEPIEFKHKRDPNQRDLLLYLPDSIIVQDRMLNQAWKLEYEFEVTSGSKVSRTAGLARTGANKAYSSLGEPVMRRDHQPGQYAKSVEKAKEEFKVGNLFEAVLSQTFYEPCASKPSQVFDMLRVRNPSPYMFLINLGDDEWLVGASPEMYVRVESAPEGTRVESCPISGTIKRGVNALEDAERIREILVNSKEESELTMCTDVDRNDKSRICREGSVKVLGRRQIEKYSNLIHTVDHVEGYLRDGFDALDAFLTHTWAVTVTGAPKAWAMQFVERNERSPRCWYGGSIGLFGFDGHLNTGMTLRTIRLKNGIAEVRAGATLLYDSNPEDEEKETELKASAFRDAVVRASEIASSAGSIRRNSLPRPKELQDPFQKNVVVIDHQDSFVHTLSNYVRQVGANVVTVRFGVTREYLSSLKPDLVIMSPGPGNPKAFNCSECISMLCDMKLPVFGVCLGLQSIVEHFGGKLGVLSYPMHGKPSKVIVSKAKKTKWGIFDELPDEFSVGRYHSLYGTRDSVEESKDLLCTAQLEDGLVMGIEHTTLPLAAVQFHPESILTQPVNGLRIILNALRNLRY